MAGRPEIINKSKASSHPLKPGRFYTGSVTAVLSNGKINVKIPELGTQYGPLMPLNTTSTSRYVVGDSVKCAFADEFFNEIIVFGSTRVKEDVFAVSDRGIDRYANQSARNTDIPTPEEGRVVYLLDSDELQIYNGTEWITVIDTGNSENITAATLVATSASIGSLTVTSASTLTVLGSANLTASTTIGDISSTELSYLNGVTSAIQTQINTKSPSASPTFTGPATIRAAATQDGVILQGRAGGTSTYAVTLTPGTLTGSRTITLPDTAGTVITTGDSGTVTSTMIANDTIVNADINSAAAIADTKLATISTAGKVSNSATTATSANTASAIVARDASGNFSAGTITATLSGNATTATTAAGVSASAITGQTGMWTSAGRPGASRLYRNDGDDAYNVQTTWDGTRWLLRGYLNSSYHAPCRVDYADSAGSAGSAGSVPASGITGQAGMWTSAARPGPYRLYRRDDNNDFSVQTYWTGARWRLYGYVGDSGHADTHVGYADSAGNASTLAGYSLESSGFNNGVVLRHAGSDSRIDAVYFLGIGVVGVGSANGTMLRRRNSDGYFLIDSSRQEFKRDIETLSSSNSLELLKALNPVKFNWKEEFDGPPNENPLMQEIRWMHKEYGFIVEEVEAVSPELVTYLDDKEDKIPRAMSWQQNGIISLLVSSVQNLASRVEALEHK